MTVLENLKIVLKGEMMKLIDLINRKYNEWLEEQVKHYRTKYKFADETTSHNNKSDAFKHAFSSAKLTMWFSPIISEVITNNHEWNNLKNGAPVDESLMDLHNNLIGRLMGYKPSLWFNNDKLAKAIISSFSDLICNLDDNRIKSLKEGYYKLMLSKKDAKKLEKYL